MLVIPDLIKQKFHGFEDVKCWGFCNTEKVPVQAKHPDRRTSWKKNPDLGVITLPEIIDLASDHVGFGIFTSKEYNLGCLDFDHFLKNGEPDYNNKLDLFLQMCPTFAEISSSGNGVHAFCFYDRDDENVKEFAIDPKRFGMNIPEDEYKMLLEKKVLPGGKFYCDKRFIKLTGILYKDNDYEIFKFDKIGYNTLTKTISVQQELPLPAKRTSIQTSFTRSWSDILCEAGILHIEAREYTGKIAPKSKKEVVECLKIPCPNRSKHQAKRQGDISADLAILSRYSDNTSSCTCNHNSCDPATRPNLLQKLWDEIKQPRIDIGEAALKRLGVNVE
jgi:hypothetical protein